tara:strand:+ start:241 stop:354 length:114 start_codon:yes stop_codon:yes gene_type:complete
VAKIGSIPTKYVKNGRVNIEPPAPINPKITPIKTAKK